MSEKIKLGPGENANKIAEAVIKTISEVSGTPASKIRMGMAVFEETGKDPVTPIVIGNMPMETFAQISAQVIGAVASRQAELAAAQAAKDKAEGFEVDAAMDEKASGATIH